MPSSRSSGVQPPLRSLYSTLQAICTSNIRGCHDVGCQHHSTWQINHDIPSSASTVHACHSRSSAVPSGVCATTSLRTHPLHCKQRSGPPDRPANTNCHIAPNPTALSRTLCRYTTHWASPAFGTRSGNMLWCSAPPARSSARTHWDQASVQRMLCMHTLIFYTHSITFTPTCMHAAASSPEALPCLRLKQHKLHKICSTYERNLANQDLWWGVARSRGLLAPLLCSLCLYAMLCSLYLWLFYDIVL